MHMQVWHILLTTSKIKKIKNSLKGFSLVEMACFNRCANQGSVSLQK